MSQLRNQLQAARNEYQTIHYPGDLAADVLPNIHRPSLVLRIAVGVASLAAAVALAIWLVNLHPTNNTTVANSGTSGFDIPAQPMTLPKMPADFSFVPPSYQMTFPSASFPSWDDAMKQSETTSSS